MKPLPFYTAVRITWAALILSGCAATSATKPSGQVLSWGDQGDGTYRNPVLPADYSDPDVIRVGDDFYLVGSEFHFMGIQVLHSRDLVNWSVIGQVFNRLKMSPKYDTMRGYAEGTWAPTLRYHNGEFYLYVCTPQDGLFMWHTKNPAGPWSEMVTVKTVARWEDPCPFWVVDGRAWLIHSVYGAGPLILHQLSADGAELLDDGVEIYRGNVSEGPKLFKRHGFYYISLPEGGVDRGGQTVLRAKTLTGPYERREVLPNGSPHQGGLVELSNGEAWFIGFKSTGFLGRISHLLPVKWGDDDWPVFGDKGQPVAQWAKPNVGQVYPVEHPGISDEFEGPALSPIWQWNHNPDPTAWSLTARPGWLRLKALPADALVTARNTLTEKLWGNAGAIEVKLDTHGMADGQHAGFAFVSGKDFGWAGVVQTAGTKRLGSAQSEDGPILQGDALWLRGEYHGATAMLAYSTDGKNYTNIDQPVVLRFASWKGARLGVFSYGPAGGTVDLDYIRYQLLEDAVAKP